MMHRIINRMCCIKMLLNNVVYVSYMVPAERIFHLVPDKLPLAMVDGDKAFISIVLLRCRDVHLASLPFPRFDYYQLNVRTYVIDPHTGNQAVYFLKSGVTSFPVSIATRIFGLSWQYIKLIVNVENGDNRVPLSYDITGEWEGEIEIHTQRNMSGDVDMSPFISMESAVNYLVRPLIGFYRWGNGVGRFRIRHPEVYPEIMKLGFFQFPVLDELNVLKADELLEPHSVLHIAEARFTIYLPPEKVITL